MAKKALRGRKRHPCDGCVIAWIEVQSPQLSESIPRNGIWAHRCRASPLNEAAVPR
jgi:hypothetical protein